MNNFMKRIITTIILISMYAGGLVACSNDNIETENNSNKVEVEETEEVNVEPEVEKITFEKVDSKTAVVMAKNLNVRKEPNVNSTKVATLIKNTIVVITEKSSNGWYFVVLDGKELGYVAGNYIKKQDVFFRYLIKDIQIEGAHLVKKGEQVKISGTKNNKLIAKHSGVTFEIDTNSISTLKPETKPQNKPEESDNQNVEGEVIGSYTTYYNQNQTGRSENIRLAAKTINITLEPGQEFKWSEVVGQATSAKGYKPAPIFVGNKVVQGTGGGVCQVSSTLYNAVLQANLKVTERHKHSLPVSYVPSGKDATVSYGSLDFRFINNKDYSIKIAATAGNGSVTVKILK